MIEISHKQARYMLREVEDRRLPDEQWAALQAHLERCQECRAYQARISGLGRGLHRLMQQRWGTVGDPNSDLLRQILARRAARRVRARRAAYSLFALMLVIGVVALQWRAQVFSPA